MPTFLMISRHTPENCPLFNENVRRHVLNLMSKMEAIGKKYGVKTLWGGSVPTEHLSVYIFEAPSLEAWEKAGMDPDMMALFATETAEIKLAVGIEESRNMLKGR